MPMIRNITVPHATPGGIHHAGGTVREAFQDDLERFAQRLDQKERAEQHERASRREERRQGQPKPFLLGAGRHAQLGGPIGFTKGRGRSEF